MEYISGLSQTNSSRILPAVSCLNRSVSIFFDYDTKSDFVCSMRSRSFFSGLHFPLILCKGQRDLFRREASLCVSKLVDNQMHFSLPCSGSRTCEITQL